VRRATVLLLLLAAACTTSTHRAGPSATPSSSPKPACVVAPAHQTVPAGAVLVRGCVGTAAGRPATATVVVGHRAGLLESLGIGLELVVTAGTACLVDEECLGPQHPTRAVRTDAAGQFSLLLPKGHDATQPGTDRVLLLLPGQLVVETSFHVDQGAGQDVALQPVELWQPGFSFAVRGSSARASWTPFRGRGTSGTLAVEDRYGHEHRLEVRSGEAFDAHLLPPGTDQVQLVMETRTATYRTRATPARVADAAVSKAAGCSVTTSRGVVRKATELDGCRLTDGDWSQDGFDLFYVCGDTFATADCLSKGWSVRLDLGRVRTVSDVVLAGVFGASAVEASADGRSWQQLRAFPSAASTVVSTGPLAPVQVRYLRVTGDDLSRLTEVAAFP
jgi:hypothetical protein